jgi:tRNA(adenine34) deaminase
MVKTWKMHLDLCDLMGLALKEAEKGFSRGEVPVGAIVATPDGQVVAKAHNQPITLKDPTAHAEILAMRKAGLSYQNYRLSNTLLVVTIEPCLMCMGAALNARIDRLVFGALDPKAGAVRSLYKLAADKRLNHRIDVVSGIREEECLALMQDFFRARRKKGE